MAGSYTGRIVDAITSGTTRLVTSKLEDVNNRLQLGYLKVYIESRQDGGAWSGTFGFLTAFRLVSDIEWEFTIQDPKVLYDGFELFNATSSQTISSFLAAWPNRGCLIGGPIMGSWLTVPDLGGWTMRVHRLTPGGGHLRYWLEPIKVYGPASVNAPAWVPGGSEVISNAFAAIINEPIRTLPRGAWETQNTSVSTVADAYSRAFWWTGFIYLIDGAVFRPIPPSVAGGYYSGDTSFARSR